MAHQKYSIRWARLVQGSQFTSEMFTSVLLSNDIAISMDGKGRAIDNIFVERLWRTVKYENIYLKSYRNGHELEIGLVEYFYFYTYTRKHVSLSNMTPGDVHEKQPPYQHLSYFINREKKSPQWN